MSKNKKAILFCVVALVAIGVFLGIQGQKQSPEVVDVVDMYEKESGFETETPDIEQESVKSTETPETSKTADKRKNVLTKNKEGKKNEKKEKSHSDKDSSDQADSKDSSNDKESEKSKAKKPASQDSSKKSKQSVGDEKKQERPGASPQQVTPQPAKVISTAKPKKQQCNLTITCKDAFHYKHRWNDNAKKVIPESGIFLQGTFEVQEGDTVFDVMKRACGEKNVLLDYVFTPMYSTYYIKGIGNLYEFDCGAESGWLYKINGENPGYGCSQYKLSGGEEIVFYYSCEK